MINEKTLNRFINLFDGYKSAYGTLSDLKEDEHGKINGRNTLYKKKLTSENYLKHLQGKVGLRLIPLKENNKVRYAAIDIDKNQDYAIRDDLQSLEKKIKKLGLPLIPCSSKSGTFHLYCFAKEDVDAKIMLSKMNEWAGLLGYGTAEKFPKQISRLNESDTGTPLNLPYFDAENTDRYAYNKGKKITLEEFIEYAEVSSVTQKELISFKYEELDENYSDAPPCIQMMASTGIKEGSRNNGLYAFAVYYKKKFPEDFENKIMEANYNVISPSLPYAEASSIIKSVNKKDFFYKCNEAPCASFCNKSECHKRKYGIGNADYSADSVVIDNITKHESGDEAIWIVECLGKRVSMTSEELYNPKTAAMKIWTKTNKIMKPVKTETWISILNNLMKTLVTKEDPEEISEIGQFKQLFIDYFEDNFHGGLPKEKISIFSRKVYHDEQNQTIYFKIDKFCEYLSNKKFNKKMQDVWRWIHEEFKGESFVLKVKDEVQGKWKSERVCKIPEIELFDKTSLFKDKL
jgi:hypothetical protein